MADTLTAPGKLDKTVRTAAQAVANRPVQRPLLPSDMVIRMRKMNMAYTPCGMTSGCATRTTSRSMRGAPREAAVFRHSVIQLLTLSG